MLKPDLAELSRCSPAHLGLRKCSHLVEQIDCNFDQMESQDGARAFSQSHIQRQQWREAQHIEQKFVSWFLRLMSGKQILTDVGLQRMGYGCGCRGDETIDHAGHPQAG